MQRIRPTLAATLAIAGTVAYQSIAAAPVSAQPTTTPSPQPEASATLHCDLEIDPTAYLFSGYSLHSGIGWGHLRLDLGAFAMAVPEAVHGNKAFAVAFNGFGARLDYYPAAEQLGGFFGVGAGMNTELVQLQNTDLASRHTAFSTGIHTGWRFDLGSGFYATPWIGLDYTLNAQDVKLGGQTFSRSPWSVFPAIHVGYRFR